MNYQHLRDLPEQSVDLILEFLLIVISLMVLRCYIVGIGMD